MRRAEARPYRYSIPEVSPYVKHIVSAPEVQASPILSGMGSRRGVLHDWSEERIGRRRTRRGPALKGAPQPEPGDDTHRYVDDQHPVQRSPCLAPPQGSLSSLLGCTPKSQRLDNWALTTARSGAAWLYRVTESVYQDRKCVSSDLIFHSIRSQAAPACRIGDYIFFENFWGWIWL